MFSQPGGGFALMLGGERRHDDAVGYRGGTSRAIWSIVCVRHLVAVLDDDAAVLEVVDERVSSTGCRRRSRWPAPSGAVVRPARRRERVVLEVAAQSFSTCWRPSAGRSGGAGAAAARPRRCLRRRQRRCRRRGGDDDATPMARTSRFVAGPARSRRAAAAPAARCRSLDRAGRRRDAALLLLGHDSERYQAVARAWAPKKSATAATFGDEPGRRQRGEKAPSVRPRAQPRVEDRDDAAVRVAADQPAEALPELEHRRGQRVVAEPVAARRRDALAARLDQRVARSGERQLVDHEQRERLAGRCRRPARTSRSRRAPSRPRRGTARAAARAAPRPGRAPGTAAAARSAVASSSSAR